MTAAELTPGRIRALELEELALLEEELRRAQGNRLARYAPYAKQLAFHFAGKRFRERLLMAGNQLGKTYSAASETAIHLSGRYPWWWQGRVWDRPVSGWAAGVTNEVTRDTLQLLLCGDIKGGNRQRMGTGAIPRDAIRDYSMRRGLEDAVETIIVKHGGGGDVQARDSIIGIKSYEQGREKFQGATLDFVWLDEEPDLDIYSESLTRTNATNGMVYMTFTPLLGMTDTVKRFLSEKPPGSHVTTMTIDDVTRKTPNAPGHYSPEQAALIVAGYPAHTREARAKGIPTLGSGRIFPLADDVIKVEPFPIPEHFVRIGGLDFGWDHPSAAVELCWDREADVFYVTKAHRQREQTPLLFASTIKPWGDWLPWAWPHDGLQHDKGSGEALRDQYAGHGLHMLKDKATHPPADGEEEGTGGNGVEAGLLQMLDLMQTGRWKVFSNLNDYFEEFRMYHRKDGKIVKLDDDLLSASRYAYMMRRFACTRPAPFKPFDYGKRRPLA